MVSTYHDIHDCTPSHNQVIRSPALQSFPSFSLSLFFSLPSSAHRYKIHSTQSCLFL